LAATKSKRHNDILLCFNHLNSQTDGVDLVVASGVGEGQTSSKNALIQPP
jgi:hypothetical protein